MKKSAYVAYDVFLYEKEIDTIFYSLAEPADEVRRSLINHDGYHPLIVVKRRNRSGRYDDIAPK